MDFWSNIMTDWKSGSHTLQFEWEFLDPVQLCSKFQDIFFLNNVLKNQDQNILIYCTDIKKKNLVLFLVSSTMQRMVKSFQGRDTKFLTYRISLNNVPLWIMSPPWTVSPFWKKLSTWKRNIIQIFALLISHVYLIFKEIRYTGKNFVTNVYCFYL